VPVPWDRAHAPGYCSTESIWAERRMRATSASSNMSAMMSMQVALARFQMNKFHAPISGARNRCCSVQGVRPRGTVCVAAADVQKRRQLSGAPLQELVLARRLRIEHAVPFSSRPTLAAKPCPPQRFVFEQASPPINRGRKDVGSAPVRPPVTLGLVGDAKRERDA